MSRIADLKNQKLREFLEKYPFFQDLAEAEREQYLTRMIPLSLRDQDQIYEHLAAEYEKQKIAALNELIKKLSQVEARLNKVVLKEEEKGVKAADENEIENLLQQIETA